MTKKFSILPGSLVLLLLAFSFTTLVIAAPQPDLEIALKEAVTAARDAAIEHDVWRDSPVTLRVDWSNPDSSYTHRKTYCRGVLVDAGKRVVTHSHCLQGPWAVGEEKVPGFITLTLANKASWVVTAPAGVSGSFAYFEVPSSYADGLIAAQFKATAGNRVISLLPVGKPLSGQEFYFDGTERTIGDLLVGGLFTLSYVWRERLVGEPVYIGPYVIGLNAGFAPAGVGSKIYLKRPQLELFSSYNGGLDLLK